MRRVIPFLILAISFLGSVSRAHAFVEFGPCIDDEFGGQGCIDSATSGDGSTIPLFEEMYRSMGTSAAVDKAVADVSQSAPIQATETISPVLTTTSGDTDPIELKTHILVLEGAVSVKPLNAPEQVLHVNEMASTISAGFDYFGWRTLFVAGSGPYVFRDKTHQPLADFGGNPNAIAAMPGGKTVFTIGSSGELNEIHTGSFARRSKAQFEKGAWNDLAASADGSHVIALDPLYDRGRIVDAETGNATSFATGSMPSKAIERNGVVYVSNRLDGTISKIDVATGKTLGAIRTGGAPYGLAFWGDKLCVTDPSRDLVLEFDAATGTKLGEWKTGRAPHEIVAVNGILAVCNRADATVSAIASDGTAVTIPVGTKPGDLAAITGTSRVYVADSAKRLVYVLDLKEGKVLESFAAPGAKKVALSAPELPV